MGLGRGTRRAQEREQERLREQRTLEAFAQMHEDFAALQAQLRTFTVEVSATLESRLRSTIESVNDARSEGLTALEHAMRDFSAREEQMLTVLRQVGQSYELLAEHITADKIERKTLIDALGGAVKAVSGAVPMPKLIGGTIFGNGNGNGTIDDIQLEDEPAIDLTRAEHAVQQATMQAVEVRCRFGDRWVDGFEVADVLDEGDEFKYRLRRKSDGTVLPTWFDARNVRRASPPAPTVDASAPARPWWRS
jgi:hypothetical protein